MKKTVVFVTSIAAAAASALLFFAAPTDALGQDIDQGCRRCVREFCKELVQDCRQTGDVTSPECQQALLCVQDNCGAVCVLP